MLNLRVILLLSLLNLASSNTPGSVKVYHRSNSNEYPGKNGVELAYQRQQSKEEKPTWKEGISICLRYKYEQLGKGYNPLFHVGNSSSTSLIFYVMWEIQNGQGVLGGSSILEKEIDNAWSMWTSQSIDDGAKFAFVRFWHHFCLSIDAGSYMIQLVVVSKNLKLEFTYFYTLLMMTFKKSLSI